MGGWKIVKEPNKKKVLYNISKDESSKIVYSKKKKGLKRPN
jgi:hypothetical protein